MRAGSLRGKIQGKKKAKKMGGSVKFTYFFSDCIANIVIIFFCFAFAALNLTQRTSEAAFDTKIQIKIEQGEFAEALKLLNEWRRFIDPEVREKFD